jgi:nucleotide-binding universal stress UspA family protein
MKVIVGVDGSSNSFAAVRFIGRLLSPERDQLALLFATPAVSFEAEERLDPEVEERARAALGRAVLEAALERLPPDWRTRAATKEVVGSPAPALLAAVTELAASMIVVGFRGTSLIERFILGSVSRAVIHSATVPVLVVKSTTKGDSTTELPVGGAGVALEVLAAYDGTPFADSLAKTLQRLCWPPEASGRVMTVIPSMHVTELPDWIKLKRDPDIEKMAEAWRKEHEQCVRAARQELEQFQKSLPPCFAQHEPIVAEGSPAEELLEAIDERSIDLVAMGSRGSGAVERLLLGSTSARVLTAAPCSVLIVR